MEKRIVEVLVPVALDHTYSYRVPADLELGPGDLVGVPLGASETLGVVWATDATVNLVEDQRCGIGGLGEGHLERQRESRQFAA